MNEIEAMREMIEGQRKCFERNIDYLIEFLKEKKSISTAIGEVSAYECLDAVRIEFNLKVDSMLRI